MNPYFSSFRTFRSQQESIEQNFEVSVVMPFYKKLKAFKQVFPKNRKYFERNGIEVIIVVDCPDEKDELLAFIQEYPFVNWRVIYNDNVHDWRNPTKPINVGIRFATKRYIMVCSPESEFFTDAILQLRTGLEEYLYHYAIGNVCFAGIDKEFNSDTIKNQYFRPFGSIMVEKKHLEAIKGYDEALNQWGGDDDNIRARLELSGIQELFLPEVILIHRDDKQEDRERRKTPSAVLEHLLFPKQVIVNTEWGKDFDTVIYDWQDNPYSKILLESYLSTFLEYELKANALSKTYDKILLVPSYNEQEQIIWFLQKNASYFDAIILLDDESTNETYQLAEHPKIVLKFKKRRKEFNDLENRNILLNAASFFKHRWIFFLDTDEVMDPRFADFNFFTNQDTIDSVIVNMVNLWDREDQYHRDYPYTRNGICLRYKMFRNIGRTQILSPKGKLHCDHTSYASNVYHAPLLIKHYGHLDKEKRKRKHDYYVKIDTEQCQKDYSHLIDNNVKTRKVMDITIEDLQAARY